MIFYPFTRMNGPRYFIEKNGRNIWSYKRLQSAIDKFELVCERSFKHEDVVRLVTENGDVIRTF